jgi:hypothetical protein
MIYRFARHLLYLITPSAVDPITNLTSSAHLQHPLPFSAPFTFLHVLIHVNLNQHFLPPRHTLKAWLHSVSRSDLAAWLPVKYQILAATSAMAPVLSVAMLRSAATTLWWSLTGIIVGVCWIIERWDAESESRVRELENMRYEAKGA